jgi:hypothetical protein
MPEEPEYISNPIVDRSVRPIAEDAEGHVATPPGVETPSVRRPDSTPEDDDSEGHYSSGVLSGNNKKTD